MFVSAICQHESAIGIPVSSPSWPSLPPSTPSHPLGCYRAQVWVPWAIQQIWEDVIIVLTIIVTSTLWRALLCDHKSKGFSKPYFCTTCLVVNSFLVKQFTVSLSLARCECSSIFCARLWGASPDPPGLPDTIQSLCHITSLKSLKFWVSECTWIMVCGPYYKNRSWGTTQVAQWLRLHAPNAEGPRFNPCQGTRSHMPQLKILRAATK